MAFCRNCGAENDQDMNFCEKCGSQLTAAVPTPQHTPATSAAVPAWLIVVPFIGAIVSIILNIYYYEVAAMIIAICGGIIAVRTYTARKTGIDVAAITIAAVSLLLNIILLFWD